MAYVTLDEIKAIVPPEILTMAVDDGNYGADVNEVWPIVAEAASRRVDGILGGRYTVPFSAPYPALVTEAAMVFAAHMLFLRRQSGDKNPYAADADKLIDRLQRVADGLADLSTVADDDDPVAITEPARTYAQDGRLML